MTLLYRLRLLCLGFWCCSSALLAQKVPDTVDVQADTSMLYINTTHTSKNLNDRPLFLILHHTGGGMLSSFETLMGQTTRAVSSHFLVNDQPSSFFPDYIYGLVPEEKRAWHAGISNWTINGSLNSSSIGIETINLDGNLYSYPDEQVKSKTKVGRLGFLKCVWC